MKRHSQQAFTLVETLVSLFILSIAITGAFAAMFYNVGSANAIKNSFIASGLAQEGLEVVRNLRDKDWLESGQQFGYFGTGGFASGPYRIQWNSTKLDPAAANPLLKDISGLYSYDAGNPTIFYRSVDIQSVPPGNVEIKVTVTVTWGDRGLSKQLSAEEHLYNWY